MLLFLKKYKIPRFLRLDFKWKKLLGREASTLTNYKPMLF